MEIIKVKNLSRYYEYYKKEPGLMGSLKNFVIRKTLYAKAVQNINFSIKEGELVGFLGPNGAGKTTTLKMLSGLLHPTKGRARVLNFDPSQREREYRRQFALVMGQKQMLIKDLPAMDSFILNKEIYGISNDVFDKNIEELSIVLDVKNILDVPVRKLSLGQRMKCELIAALIHNPKVLFLDEPTIGLDVVAQKKIRDFIKQYNKEKKTTVILTSHYMEDIKELCERVIIINLGKIIYDGNLKKLIEQYAPYKALHVTFNKKGASLQEVERFGKIENYHQYKCTIQVPRKQAKDIATDLLESKLPVDDIIIDEPNISSVVRRIFGGK